MTRGDDKQPCLSLQGLWRFKPVASGEEEEKGYADPAFDDGPWQEMWVPSNWYRQGLDHHGAVWFRRSFTVPPGWSSPYVVLRFEGVDYFAQVWLNGVYLGRHEGYFQPFEFEVGEHLRFGAENLLAVRVDSPREEFGPVWPLHKTLIKGIFAHHDTRPGGGWDQAGQDYNTGGIWSHVSLIGHDWARLESLLVTPHLDPNGCSAQIEVQAAIRSFRSGSTPLDLSLTVRPANFVPDEGELVPAPIIGLITLQPGLNRMDLTLPLENPRLWSTWDQGYPHLYLLSASLLEPDRSVDTRQETFGVREIRRDESWTWYLNGRRIFLRGSNYIATQWLGEMERERFRRDVALMREANLNAIRVHAHVSREEFYQEADRQGIMVWQDFPLQWGYADTEEFKGEAMRQLREMIVLLHNHPSIVVWCCHNESPWDAPWLGDEKHSSASAGFDPLQNKDLDERLYQEALALDRSRVGHMNSGTGDGHVYPGWYEERPRSYWDFRELPGQPFVTEFGAQALPGLDSLKKTFRARDLWPPHWEVWAFHDFQREQTFDIAGVEMGDSLAELVAHSQDYQAQLIRFAIECYRRAKYHPMTGVFHFMFVEDWPSITWAVLDYFRVPKQGYYSLRTAFQPVLVSLEYDREAFQRGRDLIVGLWIINDLPEAFPQARLRWRLSSGSEALRQGAQAVSIPADSVQKITSISGGDYLRPGRYLLQAWLETPVKEKQGENTFAFEIEGKGDVI